MPYKNPYRLSRSLGMIVVIQCAAKKAKDAGYLTAADGKKVAFVADPTKFPENGEYHLVKPDDIYGNRTWREWIVEYNKRGGNPCGLLPAYQLYHNEAYRDLAKKVGINNLYILSAGWGLIRADFLTPYYDITFSQAAGDSGFRRREKDKSFLDFNQLQPANGSNEPILFVGGNSYRSLFNKMVNHLPNPKVIFHRVEENGKVVVEKGPNHTLYVPFPTKRLTNWHYSCAEAIIEGEFDQQFG